MAYSNLITMQDLFMNPQLKKTLPQFGRNQPLQNVYSFAEIRRRVLVYLQGILGATKTNDGLRVKGTQPEVLQRIKALVPTIEGFFNNVPSVVKNLRQNSRMYLPYATLEQIKDLKDGKQKISLIQEVLDNLQYNSNLTSENKIIPMQTSEFLKRQAEWKKRVGFKE